VTGEIAEQLLPIRRLRAFPRVVKRKMSSFGVKRAKHRTWPRPTIPPADAIVIVGASKPTVSVGLRSERVAVRVRRRHCGMTPKQTGAKVAFGRAVCRGAGVDLAHRLLA